MKKSKKKTWIIVLVVVILLAGGGFLFIRSRMNQALTAVMPQYEMVVLDKGDIETTITSTGTIRTRQSSILTWKLDGQIENLHFKPGDNIEKDEVLANLKLSTISQSVMDAKVEMINVNNEIEKLNNSDSALANAELAAINCRKEVENAEKARTRLNYTRGTQSTINQYEAVFILAEADLKIAKENFSMVQDSPENSTDRAAMLSMLTQAEHTYYAALGNLNYVKSEPKPEEIEEADAQLALARANLKNAEEELERIKNGNGVDPREMSALESRLDSAKSSWEMQYLKAPFSGTITNIFNKSDDLVSAGDKAVQIEDFSSMQIKVMVPEIDLHLIKVGQNAEIKFEAISGAVYKGVVSEIARAGTQTEKGTKFEVTVELNDVDEAVFPNMTASVSIITEQVNEVLRVPNTAIIYNDGSPIVMVQTESGELKQVTLKLGLANEYWTEILEGDLQLGDMIQKPIIIQESDNIEEMLFF